MTMMIRTKVDAYKLRSMCIKYNFYECGSEKEYGEMLFRFHNQVITGDDIESLAMDIKAHSITELFASEIADRILDECCYHYLVPVLELLNK